MDKKRLERIASPRTAGRAERPAISVQGESAIKRVEAIAGPRVVKATRSPAEHARISRLAGPRDGARKGAIGSS